MLSCGLWHRLFCSMGANISEGLLSTFSAEVEGNILFRNVGYHPPIVITQKTSVSISTTVLSNISCNLPIYYYGAIMPALCIETLKERFIEVCNTHRVWNGRTAWPSVRCHSTHGADSKKSDSLSHIHVARLGSCNKVKICYDHVLKCIQHYEPEYLRQCRNWICASVPGRDLSRLPSSQLWYRIVC
jgi:hypothetical protein